MPPAPSPDAYGGKGALLLGITWAETALATTIILARTYAATRLVERVGMDLFWILLTWAMSITAQVLLTISVVYGAGNHTANLTHDDIKQGIKWNWMGQLVAIMAIGFAKIAVIALIMQIQGPGTWRNRVVLHVIWVSNTVINTIEVVLILHQCSPIPKLWDSRLDGSCGGRHLSAEFGYFQGAWGAASDVALALYPMYMFWNLNMSRKRKIFLSALMSGGLIAAIAATIKTIYIKVGPSTIDPTYTIYPLWISTYTEMWLILMLSSIPQLRILFLRKLRPTRSSIRLHRPAFFRRNPRPRVTNDDTIHESTIRDSPIPFDEQARPRRNLYDAHSVDVLEQGRGNWRRGGGGGERGSEEEILEEREVVPARGPAPGNPPPSTNPPPTNGGIQVHQVVDVT